MLYVATTSLYTFHLQMREYNQLSSRYGNTHNYCVLYIKDKNKSEKEFTDSEDKYI